MVNGFSSNTKSMGIGFLCGVLLTIASFFTISFLRGDRNYQSKLRDAQNTISELTYKVSELTTRVQDLSGKLSESKRTLKETTGILEERTAELAAITKRFRETQERARYYEKLLAEYRKQSETVAGDIYTITERISDHTNAVQSDITRLSNLNATISGAIESLQRNLNELK